VVELRSSGWRENGPETEGGGWPIVAREDESAIKPTRQEKVQGQKAAPFNLLRLTYLEAIVDAALRAQPAPAPPKRARDQLNAATTTAGGPVQWARAQPEYAATLERKQRKLAGKAPPPVEVGSKVFLVEKRVSTPVAHANGHQQRPGVQITRTSIENLCRERARLSTALAAAEADIRRRKEAIAEIDRKLALANSSRR
jgi:hypothetical protein